MHLSPDLTAAVNHQAHLDLDLGPLLSPDEFAEQLRIKRNTLAVWRCTRTDGPVFVKIGSRVFYPTIPNQKWLSEQTRTHTF